jgi:translation initiation factor 6
MTIGGSTILGALTAMNSHGAIITDFVDDEELEPLKAQIENVCRIPDKLNAAGNNILVNDHGALVHPELSKEAINAIEDTLNVEVLKGTIAGLKNVGALAVATNKGVLCHPKTTRAELKKLKELFKVHVDIGTANYGTPLIGACIIANTKGVITGPPTTGIELGRIEDTLGYI